MSRAGRKERRKRNETKDETKGTQLIDLKLSLLSWLFHVPRRYVFLSGKALAAGVPPRRDRSLAAAVTFTFHNAVHSATRKFAVAKADLRPVHAVKNKCPFHRPK